MKTIQKTIALAIVLSGFAANAKAQTTASATTTATLLTPISITKTVDLNFGTLAASATAGTVSLDYSDVRTASASVKLLAGTAAQKTAQFRVDGEGTSGFSISIPTGPITLSDGASHNMTVSSFTCDLGASGTLVGGTKTLKVKAVLNVAANQVAGVYQNTATDGTGLFVTVNYN